MDRVINKCCEEIHSLCRDLAGKSGLSIMEVCGTHTMVIAQNGLRSMLPANLRLISGPGCPVCVTDQSYMDHAVMLARRSDVIIATFGDMVRVPGRLGSLAQARSQGAGIEVVYSAQQAVELARKTPQKQVVFLAVGFETTAPCSALALQEAAADKLENFTLLTAHKLILPAMNALLGADDVRIDGFLCPGHVSVILGYEAYGEIAEKYRRPCVVAGFETVQVFLGVLEILRQLQSGQFRSCSVYPPVSAGGNRAALALLEEIFQVIDAPWRALGIIPGSGLALREQFSGFDAARRFELPELESYEMPGCRCGDVISGRLSPAKCKLFGRRCTPRDPVGPCMVSSEGACAAAFKYDRK